MQYWVRTLIAIGVCCCLTLSVARAEPPYSLEDLFTTPWVFGTSAAAVSISDDGAYVACGFNADNLNGRDLWIYTVATGEWRQVTDYWADREARMRREFENGLAKDRLAWEEEHAKDTGEDDAVEDGGSTEGGSGEDMDEGGEDESVTGPEDGSGDEATGEEDTAASGDEEEFDEQERREEFEEDLEKARDDFSTFGETLFLRDSTTVIWPYNGSVWSLDAADPRALPVELLRHEQYLGGFDRVQNSDALILSTDGDALLWWPRDGRIRQLTTGGNSDFNNAGAYAISADLKWLAAIRYDYSRVRKQCMPDLLSENPGCTRHYHVRPQDTPENLKLFIYDLTENPPWPIEVELEVEPYFQTESLEWSPVEGDNRLLVGTISSDTQDYRAYTITPVADAAPGDDEYTIELTYHEHDNCWINWGLTGVRWTRDAAYILQSEMEGMGSIYTLARRPEPVEAEADEPADGTDGQAAEGEESDAGTEPVVEPEEDSPYPAVQADSLFEPVPLFRPSYEVKQIWTLRNSDHALLYRYAGDPGSTVMSLLNLATGEVADLTPGGKWCELAYVSEDESLLAIKLSDEQHMGELALVPMDGGPGDVEIIRARNVEQAFTDWLGTWNTRYITVPTRHFPEYEEIIGSDSLIGDGGIRLKAWLPRDWTADGTYPLMVHVHGAGYTQNVMRSLGFYELYFAWIADKYGWVVADVDYRGSEGYGRDWRVDVWGRLGHLETEDILAVKTHMVDNFGADPGRSVLWGWSYGGFQTLMTLGLAPGEFPVGCAVAPVNKWDNYFYWYSTCRLGHPGKNEDLYERSAAETYLENITDELLIIHGLRDDNTLFQSVAQYLEEGHELGINIELKLFPSDSHGIGNDFHYVRVFEAIADFSQDHWD